MKYRSYKQVRKLHVILSINSKKAIAAQYSNGAYSDHYGACDLLSFQHAIKALYADRAPMIGASFINCAKNMI